MPQLAALNIGFNENVGLKWLFTCKETSFVYVVNKMPKIRKLGLHGLAGPGHTKFPMSAIFAGDVAENMLTYCHNYGYSASKHCPFSIFFIFSHL